MIVAAFPWPERMASMRSRREPISTPLEGFVG
jgi:hypothetical protein